MVRRRIKRQISFLTSAVLSASALPAVSLAAPTPAPASPTPAPASATSAGGGFFAQEVKPLLEKRCLGCHGVGAKLSHLDLRTREAALKGGNRGASFVAGNADKSLFYHVLLGDRGPQMPPGGKLPAAEIATFKRWLEMGAPWGESVGANAAEQVWWSFKPPVQPKVPQPKRAAWVRNPIDAFVLQRLEAEGLTPSPAASRQVLIRRAYMDLIGIPPTPDEVRAFEADKSPNAWEKVVDHLLASPQYGERWARHWLDLVRYADSSGFEGDKDRPLAWRYRDYVINAFNADKPYTEFIREQLAGDELRPHDPEALVATGYLACGPEDQVQHDAKTRSDELDDLVSTTTSAFLGLTVGCARCHDHKYDRVKQEDYYRLAAIFAPTERREMEIPTSVEKRAADAKNAALNAQILPLKAEAEPLRQRGMEAANKAGKAKPKDEEILAALPEPERKQLAELEGKIKALEAQRPQLPKALVVTDKGNTFAPSHLLIRGDAYHLGQEVQPGFIVALPGGTRTVQTAEATPQTTGRRKALADWLCASDNPLTARVWMNRVWQHHFGRGIVASVSNFGVNGELPTHQDLLDWLALRFQSEGYRVKPIHRLILLSNTYKQASTIRADAAQKDPLNRYLWRMPVRRLEAEAIRDSILAVSGALNRQMGGDPVYPPVDPVLRAGTFLGENWPLGEDSPKTWRRSVYVKVKRSLILPQLDVFDCPEITAAVAQRNTTTTPTQALMLLNDPLIIHQAEMFAERVHKEAGDAPGKQVEQAYWLALGRAPNARELALGTEFLKNRPLKDFCHTVLNLNEFLYSP